MISVSSIKEIALDYYDRYNWFVFPAHPTEKKPFGGFRWKPFGDSRPDRSDLSSWREWDARGVRLAARTGAVSGIFVLDCDSREALEYVRQHGHEPTPMVQSGREGGGQHIYFKHPGFKVKNATNLAGIPGMDIRGEGGIVIAPPSPHASGRKYEWIISPDEATPAPAPQWLLDLLQQEQGRKEPLNVSDTMAGIPEGQRDSKLFSLAAKLRNQDIPYEVALAMLEVAANSCTPPFPLADAHKKVDWVWKEYSPSEAYLVMGEKPSTNGHSPEGFETFNLHDLMEEEFPEIKWAIKGLVPEGTMLFAGKPKMGKSWMALGWCISIATGGKALGKYDVEVGDVLYLALEDNKRRLQSRARELLKSDLAGNLPPRRLDFRIRAKRLDTGLIEDIEEWLKAHPAARLIVIDTLGAVRGRGKHAERGSLHQQDYEVGAELTKLAGEYSVAIIIIHHLKKGEADDPLDLISGSTGLTGGMDGALVLTRTRSASDGILKAVHRELEDDPEIALQKVDKSQGWWRYIGEAEEYLLSKERRDIFEALSNAEAPMTPTEIAEAIGKLAPNVRKLLQKMRDDGLVDNEGYGKYVIATGVTPPPSILLIPPISPDPKAEGKEGSEGLEGSQLYDPSTLDRLSNELEEDTWEEQWDE